MKKSVILSAALVAVAVASTAKADLITNGGFEQGGTGWTLNNFEGPYSAIVNVVSKSGVPVSPYPNVVNDQTGADHGFIQPNSGGYYAAVNNDANGHGPAQLVSQSIVTTIGDTYQLNFALNALGQIAGTTENNNILFQVFASNPAPTFHIDNSAAPPGWVGNFYTSNIAPVFSLHGGTTGWTLETVQFIATSSQTLITFAGINDPRYTGLDDVSLNDISAVPLPGNLTMCFIAGFVGLCGYRHRRRIPAVA